MSLLYGTIVGVITNNNIKLVPKNTSDRLLSILLKAMIVGEAITKFVVIVKVKIVEDGVSHVFIQLIYSSFLEQAIALIKGISICGSGTNLAQAYKLTRIDW